MVKKLLGHPVTVTTRRVIRAIVVTCAVILAVTFVTTLTVDLGPALKGRAEAEATRFMGRPMHIGRLSVHLWRGRFVLEDLLIEGLSPQSRPFLTARRIDISMPWSTLVDRRVVFDTIEMTDWRMYVELLPDGRHNFPRFTRQGPREPSAWTTTLQYVRAHRGEFTYQDHGLPWSTVARNLDVVVARPTSEYRGRATFTNGTVAIRDFVPMRADMSTTFRIDGSRVVLTRIDLETDGTESVLDGEVDLARWPNQSYNVSSRLELPRMRDIFFADDAFSLSGEAGFEGTFTLFREVVDGHSRTGRELAGTFESDLAMVNAYRFGDLRGRVRWVPEFLEVSDATASAYGGVAHFGYRMAPLGVRGTPAAASFDATYEGVDLTTLTDAIGLQGLRLAGRASGSNALAWPLGRFAERTGQGEMRIEAPAGVALMTRELPRRTPAAADQGAGPAAEPFSNHRPREPVPLGGVLVYGIGPEWVDIGPSRLATPETYVEFEGRTAYGTNSRFPFHVSSADWQESDRLLAGIMTAFGNPTNAIPVGGFGTFDGVMVNSFRQPRIEGDFAGEQIRAFDVVWGRTRGAVTIENSYAEVRDVSIGSGDVSIDVNGRFSLGFPRRDGGEQINATIRVTRWPVVDLRHAFTIDDYDVDGRLSGEFHVFGDYLAPFGFGQMSIAEGVAYGEPFDAASAMLRLEGDGARLASIDVRKGGGRGAGAAFIGWNGTYSFNLDARAIPVETIALTRGSTLPLSGVVDFSATGSGTFDAPRYDVRGTIRDFFVADEGIGEVIGELGINNDVMTVRLEAASSRLAVSGSGRIALTPEMDADLSFRVADTSLDPYVRAFDPRLSPFTTAIASGNVRVSGQLTNVDELVVEAVVDRFDLALFDYRLSSAAPIRIALDRHTVRVATMRLVGEDTQLDLSGTVNLHDERIAVRAAGDANLGILQGLVPNIRSSGRASLEASFEGAMRQPLVTGTLNVENGRIRHFDLPHALENISGPVRFDAQGISLDEVVAQLGGGPVRFGGRIEVDGYRPARLDVAMTGENMRLRFPEGMRSVVDADLTLVGAVETPTLAGDVTVRSAVYTRRFDAATGLFDFGGGAATGGLAAAEAPLEPTLPLRYDVRINAPATLRIENNQAQLQATAELELRGTFDRPLLFGRAEVERGEVSFEGRRYDITRGTVDFNNPTRIQPFFDVETETRVRVPGETYRVTVRAAGTFDRLTPEFVADPPLPEVEVLALLFSDIAPGQDVELRQYSTGVTPQEQLLRDRATRALTGVVSSEVGRVVEQTFGVDTFQLTPSLVDPNAQSARLDPAARVTIGKRLSDRLYLTYSRSLSSSTRDQIVLLEYDQTDRFSWILSRNEDRTYALDVRVRHAF
jgi:hypothetical protein